MIIVPVVLMLLVVVFYGVLQWTLTTQPNASEQSSTTTEDGHTLNVYRHLPPGKPKGVVLCLHGLGATHFNFQFPGPSDMAGYLAREGWDVWVTGLRGDHDSKPPKGGGHGHGYSFDHFVQWDLPAVMAHVKEHAGATRIHLLGHSMGGLLAYAHVATHGEAGIASITTMGSPLGFEERAAVMDNQMWLESVVKRLPWLPIRTIARAGVPLVGLLRNRRVMQRQFHAPNVDIRHTQRAMWNSLSNVPRGVLLQFADWVRNYAFRSRDGGVDYRASLERLTVPLLVIAGKLDVLARPGNVLRALAVVQGGKKQQLVLGKDEGCEHDYGHIDLIFGVNAEKEVFTKVAAFLAGVETPDTKHRANGASA